MSPSQKLPRVLLQCRLRWQHYSLVARSAWVLILMALALSAAIIPAVESRTDLARKQLRDVRQQVIRQRASPPVEVESPDLQRIVEWRGRLGHSAKLSEYLGRFFSMAARHEVAIEQADYEAFTDGTSGLLTYRLRFESDAGYAAVRQLCDEVLRRFPFVSLDEFVLEREAVENDTLRAKLGFSFHLMARSP